ncbi:MAG: HAMP domain-containing histidine kinase [Proteobacteria bacterium]|nr:HAMP domain-containing histidine kinase [Pseudomonadota bacterium]
MPRHSAIFRLAALSSLAMTAFALVLGMLFYHTARADLRGELDQRITAERDAVLCEGGIRGQTLAGLVDARSRHGVKDMYYTLTGAGGRYEAGVQIKARSVAGWSTIGFIDGDGKPDDVRALATPLPSGEMLIVGADPESIERLDERMGVLFAIVFGAMALAGIGSSFLLSGTIRNRLSSITDTADAIIGGDLHKRMPVGARGDEFDRLSATLNLMLDRIEGLLSNLRQVSSDIAHDLRTPLTRMRQKLDAGVASHDPAVLRGAIGDALERTDDLLELFTAILSIAEIEAGSTLRAAPLDLSALTSDIADSYVLAAEDSGRSLRHSIAPGIHVAAQRELIAQLLVNLLDNALRHTPPASLIELTLVSDADAAVLTVADNGPGIEPQDRARVFDRFVRLERSRTTPGHGLGLRLVAAIAAAHDATIALEDNNPGVRMTIRFRQPGQ